MYISFIAFATFSAVSFPLLKAKIEGPDPEIPEPNAPLVIAAALTSSNYGIKIERKGSIITSSKQRPSKS